MGRRIRSARVALAGLTVLAFLRPVAAQAQQDPPKDTIAFKYTVSGKAEAWIVPVEPPIASARMVLKGTSEHFGGELTMTDIHTFNIGADGSPNRSTNGVAAFQGPNGDAIYCYWDAALRPGPSSGTIAGIANFTVRGGKGKFAGAIGSGIFNSVIKMETLEVTQVWEGILIVPKR